jgi:uncharacterized protein (DUF433 family)
MNNDTLLSRISIDPNICFGKPCIKGHRIWVSLILDYLAGGETIDSIWKPIPVLNAMMYWLVLPMVLKCLVMEDTGNDE